MQYRIPTVTQAALNEFFLGGGRGAGGGGWSYSSETPGQQVDYTNIDSSQIHSNS